MKKFQISIILYNVFINLVFVILKVYSLFKKVKILSFPNLNIKENCIWIHASSIGEGVLMFPIVKELLLNYPEYKILVTSHTETSKAIWQEEFGNKIIHCFLPLDKKKLVKNFLGKLNLKLVLWVESDFWLNYLQYLETKNIPVVLINGRISIRSFKRWKFVKSFLSIILNKFSVIYADSLTSKHNISFFISDEKVKFFGNLKYIKKNPIINYIEKDIISNSIVNRTTFLAISTHKGEEAMIARVHKKLKNKIKNLVSVIIPRHLDRVDSIVEEISEFGLNIQKFSDNISVNSNTEVYIVDVLGKVHLFSSIINIVYMGKSMFLNQRGGHNLLESMSQGGLVLFGPYMDNFKEISEASIKENAAVIVIDEKDFEKKLLYFFNNPLEVKDRGKKGLSFYEKQQDIKNKIMKAIEAYL